MTFAHLVSPRLCSTIAPCHRRSIGLAVTLLVILSAAVAWAQPSGANVISGAATVTYDRGNTTVTAGNNSVLRWNSFNVAPSQTVQFIQPTVDAKVLNWIGGLTPSQIDGTIRANGQVYLLNPAGVYFGKTAVIDAARLYAVAGSMSKEDFFAGNNRFTNLIGEVRNEGTLQASTVALLGRTVVNSGTIVSPNGFIALAAGEQVLLGRKGSSIYVDTGAGASPKSTTSSSKPGVANSGTIDAGHGSVALAAGDLYSVAISHDGTLRGKDIRVHGQGRGDVRVDGKIDASTTARGQRGGSVEITGEHVRLGAAAAIDGSGAAGGGTILVGGDAHGANSSVRNARSTFVSKGAVLTADATQRGNGGKIVVWSDGVTRYGGALSAKGSGLSGNGGFAEVSGKQLTFAGATDLSAPNGRMGSLLLDPFNITINNGTDGELNFFDPNTYSPASEDSTISWSTLFTALTNADVTVSTANTEGGNQAGNITIAESPLAGAYNTARSLTLLTAETGGIFLNAPVVNSGTGAINFVAGSGGITLRGVAGSTVLGTRGLLSLMSDGGLAGAGTLEAGTRVTFDLRGGAGSSSSPVVTSTPAITLGNNGSTAQVTNGPYFLTNVHDGGVSLNFASTAATAVDLTSKDRGGLSDRRLSLAIPAQRSFSSLRLWGSDIAISGTGFSVGTLSIGNSGNLSVPGNWTADTLVFENSGRVGSSFEQTFRAVVSNLVVNKSGGEIFVNSVRPSVVLSGESTNTDITLRASLNGDRGAVVVGESSLTATNIKIAGAVDGPGTLIATRRLELDGQTPVGRLGAPLSIKTPILALGKSGAVNNVYVANGLDAGLSVEGFNSGIMSVTSLNTARQAPAPMTITLNGLSGDVSLDLTSSSLTLAGSLRSPEITINHSGPITVSGGGIDLAGRQIRITSPRLTFNGTGDIGSGANFVRTTSSVVTLNQLPGGSVFLDNGPTDLGINFAAFTGSGSFRGRNVAILSRSVLNLGVNSLSFRSTGALDLGNVQITAGTLALAHDGALLGYTPPEVSTLVLGGGGDDGTATESLSTFASNLILEKTGSAKVYIENGNNLGLTLSGTSNSVVNISSVEANREPVRAAPLTIGGAGLSSAGPTTLASSTLSLDGGIMSPNLTIDSTDLVSGPGALSASVELALRGSGDVGTTIDSVTTDTPSLILNKPNGAVYLNNGSAALNITPTLFTGGGAFTSGDLVLDDSIDVGMSNDLTFTSSGSIDLGENGVRADTLTLAHDGGLAVSSPSLLEMNTLVLGGAGDVGAQSAYFTVSTPNLVLSKTGTAQVYFENRNDTGLTLSGSSNSVVALRSMTASGAAPAVLTVDFSGLAAGGPITLSSSSLALSGSLSGPSITLINTDAVSGSGTIEASTELTLLGTGAVGTSDASISASTPRVTINKSAGGVFLDNGFTDLALNPTALAEGGSFSGGDLTLLAPIEAGDNPVSLTSTGVLDLGAHRVAAGRVTFDHGGLLTSSGIISASSQLSLNGDGDVGTATALVPVQTRLLEVNKTGGAVYLDNGSLDLELRPNQFLGGGIVQSGSLSLLGSLDAGSSDLTFRTSRSVNLGANPVVAGQLTLEHDGALINPGTITADTLVLAGAGEAGSSGARVMLSVANLHLDKAGAANVYVDNKRDAGLTLDGSAHGVVDVSSLNTAGAANSASLTVAPAGLDVNGTAASVVLSADAITLAGGVDTPNLTINNSGSTTGPGLLHATSQLNLQNTGDIGSSGDPILADTPSVVINKSAGAVYLDNNGAPLSVMPTAFTGGGTFASGSFTLLGLINVGANNLTITTTGEIQLGEFEVIANTVTFNNGGMLSGTKVVTATQLNLGSTGTVGTLTEPLLFSGGPTSAIFDPNRMGVNLGYFGRRDVPAPPSVAADSQLLGAGDQDDTGLGESDSTTGPGKGRRSGGAAFRAISAKADLASATREQLQALGVYARPLRPEERLSREKKEAVFVAVPEREHPKESDFEVVDARIDPTALREVLRLAAETGLTDPGNARLEQVAHSLSVSFTDFSASHPTSEAASFRTWLESRSDPDSVRVVDFVKSLRSTIGHIELLGLTQQEIEVSKTQIFGNILRTRLNADPDFLRALTESPPRSASAALSAPAKKGRVALY